MGISIKEGKVLPIYKFNIVFFVFICITIFSSCSKQTIDPLYYTDADSRIAKMIFDKRIIMLGDAPHSHPVNFEVLLDVMDKWLNQIVVNSLKSQKLSLILETDPVRAEALVNYLILGNIDSLFEPGMPLENYEFYVKLKYFNDKLKSINEEKKLSISFSIHGFEDFDGNNYYLMSQRESEIWFINERDLNTSKGIVKFLKENPDEKAVVFYGGSHLQNGFVNKNLGFEDLTEDESMGYWLAYYLKKEFGDSNVITVSPDILPAEYYQDNRFINDRDKIILMDNRGINLSRLKAFKFDYFIFRPYDNLAPHLVSGIFSRTYIEKSLVNLKKLKPLKGYFAQRDYNHTLERIWLLTGKKFSNAAEMEKWYTQNGFDGFERLSSKDLDEQVYYALTSNPDLGLKYLLFQFGLTRDVLDTNFRADSGWRELVWPEEKKKIMFTNSIGIYWFGYPDEKIKAKEYLVKFSGEDFAEPEKYLQWYRMKYYGYKY